MGAGRVCMRRRKLFITWRGSVKKPRRMEQEVFWAEGEIEGELFHKHPYLALSIGVFPQEAMVDLLEIWQTLGIDRESVALALGHLLEKGRKLGMRVMVRVDA
jgi:hypothetical protein